MRVAVIHPWLPQYRVPFFEALLIEGRKSGFEIDVFHGAVPLEWQQRGDARADDRFIALPTRQVRLPTGRGLNIKSLKPVLSGDYDLIVVEQAVRNIETYRLLAHRTPVAFWGHGRTYTKSVSPMQERLKIALTKRGAWFFAYTPGGADAVIRAGYPLSRTTVVRNSIDTSSLQKSIAAITAEEQSVFRTDHDLRGATALFLGGLDDSKRIPMLLAAADQVTTRVPEFRLLVGGDGEQRSLVARAARKNPRIVYLGGSVVGREKALAMRCSEVLAMPGRVGLVAVDSFASGLPIVTTDWPWHAPEFEYLSPENSVVAPNDLDSYTNALATLLTDKSHLAKLQRACRVQQEHYSVLVMAQRFVSGLEGFRSVKA